MIKFLILFVSFSTLAEDFTVTHRGHSYDIHFAKSGVKFKNQKFKFDIPKKECSKYVTQELEETFKSSTRNRIANIDRAIMVKTDKETFYVSSGTKEGKQLIFFPDKVAKDYLIYKEACK